MLREYAPNDEKLPLVLSENVFLRDIEDPVWGLVSYVNALFDCGYTSETLRQDLADMHALNEYNSKVYNGGHSQYIDYSKCKNAVQMEPAARAARAIGLPEMAELIDGSFEFLKDHPNLENHNDVEGNPVNQLSALDSRWYKLEYTHEERAAFLNSLPPGFCDHLRDKYRFDDLEDVKMSIVSEFERLLSDSPMEVAGKQAAKLARPFYKRQLSKLKGLESSERREQDVERLVERLGSYLYIAARESSPEDRTSELESAVHEKLLYRDLSRFSKFYLHSAAWIAQHTALELVSADEYSARLDAIADASPFAKLHKRRQQLERLTDSLPDDSDIAIADAMSAISGTDEDGPFLEFIGKRLDPPRRYRKANLAKTTRGEMLVCETENRVDLFLLTENWRFSFAKRVIEGLLRLGLIDRVDLLDWQVGGLKRSPGQPTRSLLPERVLKWLKSHPQVTKGKRLASGLKDQRKAELFRTLHVPEALMRWNSDRSRSSLFRNGILDRFDAESQHIVWRFKHNSEVHRMIACTDYVEFSTTPGKEISRFSANELIELRAELS